MSGQRTPIGWLIALAGGALAVLGVVAASRTEFDETWYSPVEQVAGINHTPLLAAIEIGVGVVLVIFGLAGARVLSIVVCLAAAIAAAVVAVDPGEFQRELAMERSWAVTLAASAGALALLAMLPWPTATGPRRGPWRPTRRGPRGGYGRAMPQH